MRRSPVITVAVVALACLLVVLLGVIGFLLIGEQSFTSSRQDHRQLADRYVQEGNRESAILQYELAIAEDETNPVLYEKLSELYIINEDFDEARRVLQMAWEKTHSPFIQYLLEQLEEREAELELINQEKARQGEEEAALAAGEQGDDAANQSVSLTGKIIDATNGRGVANAKLEFRVGSSKSTSPVATLQTDRNGTYSVDLDEGRYNVTVIKEGYQKESFELRRTNREGQSENFTISPNLEIGEIRIVLSWGSSPSDLDSYLTGALDDGTTVSTNFTRKQSRDRSGNTIAELDVDSTRGFGPETTTIHNTNGVFTFAVVDFTASRTMSSSGAQVKVYVPGKSPVVIDVPPGLNNGWRVCRIDHGRVEVLNEAATTSGGRLR